MRAKGFWPVAGSVLWWLLRRLAALLRLLLAGLIALIVWASPRIWRLTVRVTRAGYLRWQELRRPLAVDVGPAPLAITATPHEDTRWSSLVKEASR
ncbi:hypothetical protein ACIODS_04280 [Micromonospora chalcea]|uniref:hypothetical protein n=1 Tax=Micromonospora chalcea TaxID=1874 RepID=UPI0037FF7EA1